MRKKLATKHSRQDSETDPANSVAEPAIERDSALAEYKPTRQKTENAAIKSSRSKPELLISHTPGARVTPEYYVERTPQMWAVGEVDIMAIKDDSLVANVSWTLGGFFFGLCVTILIDSALSDKLTSVGALMLKGGAPILFGLAVVCAVLAIVMNRRRNAIWDQIKKESEVSES
jgi:hypothetical protein